MLSFVQVTAAYSNAVLVAILPEVSDFSRRLDLPVYTPITLEQVARFNCDPRKGEVGGWLKLTNGFEFWYFHGHVNGFASPRCWYRLQDPAEIPSFFGQLKMNKKEAVQMARDALRKLGYSETMLFADGEPKVTKPPRVGANVVPRYRIEWIEPENGSTCVDVEIDGEKKELRSLMLINSSLWRDPPSVDVKPEPLPPGQMPDFIRDVPGMANYYQQLQAPVILTAEQRHALLLTILAHISEYARKLELAIPLPVCTNHVASFDAEGYPNETAVRLTSGYRFTFPHGYVTQFTAPYAFFVQNQKRDGRIEDYWGSWRMSEREAIKLARDTIKKLGYSLELLHMDKKPKIKRPIKIGRHDIPRYRLTWDKQEKVEVQGEGIVSAITSTTEIEVDADKKVVRSIYIYNRALVRPLPILDSLGPSPIGAPDTTQLSEHKFLTNATVPAPGK